jgi:uncharacterized membrane protein
MHSADGVPSDTTDGGLYRGVQRTLAGGMILSFGLMGAGLLWQLADPHPNPEQVVPLDRLGGELLAGNPLALLDLGILVLLGIPAVHLTVAAISFGRQGDRRYLMLALLVLVLLGVGAALAFVRQ